MRPNGVWNNVSNGATVSASRVADRGDPMSRNSHWKLARRWGTGVLTSATMLAVGIMVGSSLTAPTPRSAAGAAGPPSLVDGGAADQPTLFAGAQWYPWAPGPGELGAGPMAFSIDQVVNGRTVKKVVTSWNQNEDSPTAPLHNGRAVAENNGQVFVPYTALPSAFTMVGTTRLRDGSVLSMSFVPTTAPAPNRVGISMARSTDLATTWTTYTAPLVENLWKLDWYRIHRDLIELPDGTLLMGAYGKGTINGVFKEYSLVFESTDGGQSFRQRSAVNAGGSFATNELGLSRTSDGRLIAIMRGAETVARPPSMPLTQSFSSDDGRTWEPLTAYVPPAGLPNNGILPKLVLQGNGQLSMAYGRPDNNIAVSLDGTGRTWDTGQVVYQRHPGEDPLRRWMGTSGNMDLVPLTNGTSLAFGDTCHNIWWCREYGHDNKIWTRKIEALEPGAGKLDLATKVRAGAVTLAGTVVPADPRFAEQRIEGAVDGSSEYRSAARFTDKQSLTIKLDHTYTLNKIGLMMGAGEANSAKIEVSTDGRAWGAPVARTGVRTDYAMRYTDIKPVRASYVRISAAADAPLTAITELELYAGELLTFENDAINSVPRGVEDARYALTANTILPGVDNSATHLVLIDADTAGKATARFRAEAPSKTQRITMGYEGYGYGSGAIWDILGTDNAGRSVVAYKLHFSADWTNNRMLVRAWNGSAWVVVGGVGPVPPNRQWMTVTIDSTADNTTVSVNGTVAGTTDLTLAKARRFDGFRAETGLDPADVGNMEHGYDDIAITPIP
jgi:hypothetical protein